MERRVRRNFRRKMYRKPPVEVGDKVRVDIVGKGKNGDMVGKYQGFVVFVRGEGLEEGKSYEVEIKEVKRNFAVAMC